MFGNCTISRKDLFVE